MAENVQYIVIIGALAQLLGCIHYIKDTLQGKAKPNKVTWFLWSIAPLIGTAAAYSNGVRWAMLPTFMAGFGPMLVFIFSFMNRNSYWKIEKFDYICGLFSILALILWGVTEEPLIAIVLSIISDGFAAVPTLMKTIRYPETENASPYIAGLFSQLTIIPAIKTWNFSTLSFPIYLIIVNLLLIIFLNHKRVIQFLEIKN